MRWEISQENNIMYVSGKGNLTIATVKESHEALIEIYQTNYDMHIDLSGVSDCDTAGVQFIYCLLTGFSRAGNRVKLTAASDDVINRFLLTGVDMPIGLGEC